MNKAPTLVKVFMFPIMLLAYPIGATASKLVDGMSFKESWKDLWHE